jgi:hypothetical protein
MLLKMRIRKSCRLVVVVALVWPAICDAQSATTPPAAASESPPPTIDTSDCRAIASGDPHASMLHPVCEFARTYGRDLPDFICEQTTSSTGRWSTKVLKEEVRFEKGQEVYSHLIIDGKPVEANSSSLASAIPFKSAGELGSNLVNLFKTPIVAEFQFLKEANLRKIPSLVYEFHLAAEKNTFLCSAIATESLCFPSTKVNCG